MQIRTIWKGFEASESKFEAFEPNSNYSNADSNPSSEIWSIRMQVLTIQKAFKAFECQFEAFESEI